MQVAGLVTKTNAPQARFDDRFGFAGTVTGEIKTPFFAEKDNIKFQATYTSGAARYIQDTAAVAASPSVLYNPVTNGSAVLQAFGGSVAYQH